jgi:hypothetical protein
MKKSILLLITILTFFFSIIALNSSSQNWQWAKSASGSGNDYANSITVDASGNTYVAGDFNSPTLTFGSVTLTNKDNTTDTYDLFLSKYNSNGNLLWAKSFGGLDDDEAYSIKADASGNIYVAGWFKSTYIIFGSDTLTNSDTTGNYTDLFLAKFDANGNVLWAKSAGGVDNDKANSVALDNSGNAYLTGYFYSSTLSFGTTTLTNTGLYDIFLAKFDPNGNVIWAKSAGGTDYDGASSVAVDGTGNIYLAGWFESSTLIFDTTTLINVGYEDIFLAKYDAGGNVLWAKSAGGNDGDEANSIAVDTSGNIYMAGNFSSDTIRFGSTALTNTGGDAIFLAKYNSNGTILWAKTAEGSADATSLAVDNSGNSYLTGDFESATLNFGSYTLTNTDNSENTYDLFLTKYDANGNLSWAKSAGGTDDDGANAVAVDLSGNTYIAGWFYSPSLSFGYADLLNTNGSSDDIFLAKSGAAAGINELKSSLSIEVYPNPATNNIIVEVPQGSEIEILNIQGQMINSVETNTNKVNIDISSFPKGMYILEVKTLTGSEVRKFVKE